MIGICIEAGIDCPSCETQIPLNALVPTFICTACGKEVAFDVEDWKTVIEDALAEGRTDTVAELYDQAVKRAVTSMEDRYPKEYDTMTHELLIAGDPTLRVCAPSGPQ